MSSAVAIANQALRHCGSQTRLASLSESILEALLCRDNYATARDLVLGEEDWPFARRREVLSLQGTAPDEWEYSYALPAACLKPRRLEDGKRVRPIGASAPFELRPDSDSTGLRLLTDVAEAALVFTARETTEAVWPEEFAAAIGWRLAAEIALSLTGKREIAADCFTGYYHALGVARVAALGSEDLEAERPRSEFVRRRWGG